MRSIQVSTSVFAAIWSARAEGEDTEDAILSRLLKAAGENVELKKSLNSDFLGEKEILVKEGVSDARFGFSVPEGFEIFRVFKGRQYKAHAQNYSWILESDGKAYSNLSELSQAIGAAAENAWGGWSCRSKGGKIVKVGSLRDPRTIRRRKA